MSCKELEPKTADQGDEIVKFLVAGLMVSENFQRCMYLVNKLHKHYPDKYAEPDIRPMLDVQWTEYLLQIRREFGGDLWKLTSPAVVFMNGVFLGDLFTLEAYTTEKYSICHVEDFTRLGEEYLVNFFDKILDLGRNFVYLTVKVGETYLGTLLLMLYTDLVPKTCSVFLNRCRGLDGTWQNSIVTRIVPQSWIQIKGTNVAAREMSCENYIIPHDRRGVVSTCNHGKHKDNSTQFQITLDTAPWMDHQYVAFAQVIEGETVLKDLEKLKVNDYHIPEAKVEIALANEFVTEKMILSDPLLIKRVLSNEHLMKPFKAETDTAILEPRYRRGLYCLRTDNMSHLPFLHLPDRLLAYLKGQEKQVQEEEAEAVEAMKEPSIYSSFSSMSSLSLNDLNRSKGFMISRETLRTISNKVGGSVSSSV